MSSCVNPVIDQCTLALTTGASIFYRQYLHPREVKNIDTRGGRADMQRRLIGGELFVITTTFAQRYSADALSEKEGLDGS